MLLNIINLGLGKLMNSTVALKAGNALLEDKINISMMDALKITVFSMLLVFAILLVISYLVDIMRALLTKKENKNKAVEVVKPVETVVVEEEVEEDSTELVAVIMAAIEAYSGQSTKGLVVKNIKRLPTTDTTWSKAGKSELMK